MPNYIKNVVEVSDSFECIASFVRGESDFDFNKILPMPDVLKHSEEVFDGDRYVFWYCNPKTGESRPFTMEESELIYATGCSNRCDWAKQNWGTKWNARDITLSKNCFEFYTGWSSVEGLIYDLSVRFPKTTFIYKYANEDIGCDCGRHEVKAGFLLSSYRPRDLTKDSYELSLEVRPEFRRHYLWDGRQYVHLTEEECDE